MSVPVGLRYTTPSAEGEAAYQRKRAADAARAAAAVDLDGLPSASARYRPTIDGPWLKRIVERVVADRREAVLDPAMRDAMEQALCADIDRRYPVEEMAIVGRHGFGLVCDTIEIAFGMGAGRGTSDFLKPVSIAMPPRWLARRPVYLAPVVRDAEVRPSYREALPLPDAALPWFDTLYALHQERGPAILAAIGWPDKAKARTGRWPTWREIFAQFHIIGDWVADQQDPAHDAPDRGGDPELVMPPRPIRGAAA